MCGGDNSAQLLRQLADGRFHSGVDLAAAQAISRTAVWKRIKRLQADYGLVVHAVRGRGYRLAAPLELLDASLLRASVGPATRVHLDHLQIVDTTTSTNTLAAGDPPTRSGVGRVWLAEHQTAGRGRRGRSWVSTFAANLYLSLAWRFDLPIASLSALSLAAGVAVAESLAQLGLQEHTLKWPNDIMVDSRKLAGILVEASGETEGPATAIIGIGVNVNMPAAAGRSIDQPWTDIRQVVGGEMSRNELAGTLIAGLVDACRQYARGERSAMMARWRRFDGLIGRNVRISNGKQHIDGSYAGISPTGALLLDQSSGRSEHHAGEVSVRELKSK